MPRDRQLALKREPLDITSGVLFCWDEIKKTGQERDKMTINRIKQRAYRSA